MTGFGRGQASSEAATVTVEVRSVNKRHLDVSVRGPRGLGEREMAIQQTIKDRFDRGQFRVSVDVDTHADTLIPLSPERAQAVATTLRSLRDAAGIDAPVTLDQVLDVAHRFLDDASTPTARSFAEPVWTAIEHALSDALDGLHTMRADEGAALLNDLTAQLDALTEHLTVVEKRAPVRVDEAQDLLRARLSDLLSDERLDRDRLETEIAVLADKLDVHEECVRLQSHIRQFREALSDDAPAGRRLKFIMQEMLREVNTIGAKANDATISEHAVQMKELIEQLREQIRNVE
ncbi:YicC/YloC family endoribonuclease [Longimonas sp.]|uniref:YicC/YloC family endoribonuclease n=1 Tax=Longimonas sp. TaxID=2039626 RepID=UPI003974B09D